MGWRLRSGPPAHSADVCEAWCLRNKCLLTTLREISIHNKPVAAWAPAGQGLSHPRWGVWPGRVDRSIVWKPWAHTGWDDTRNHWTRTGHANPHWVMEYLSICEALLDVHTAKSFLHLSILISSKGILNDLRSKITYDVQFLVCLIKFSFLKTLTHWVVL